MKLSNAVMLGTMAGTLAVALPAAASHRSADDVVVIVKRYGDYDRADERRRSETSPAPLRRGDSSRYGYGYERRQRNAQGGSDYGVDRRRSPRDERYDERRDERRRGGGWR